mgnify:CR=1 FL=1
MKLIGDGFAINPNNNILTSPAKGIVITLSKENHSITIRTSKGYDILIHIGIDTLKLKGEGFNAFVEEGDIVTVEVIRNGENKTFNVQLEAKN